MDYYFDFDHTVYETSALTTNMLYAIFKSIGEGDVVTATTLYGLEHKNYAHTTASIFDFAREMAQKYHANEEKAIEAVKNVLANGKEFVFQDAVRFIKKLKSSGNKVHLLTYVTAVNLKYQQMKLEGSGLESEFDDKIITSEYKFQLDNVDYRNGIFFDDSPRDIKGLYKKNPIQVVRIKKPGNESRTNADIGIPEILEFSSFDDMEIGEDGKIFYKKLSKGTEPFDTHLCQRGRGLLTHSY